MNCLRVEVDYCFLTLKNLFQFYNVGEVRTYFGMFRTLFFYVHSNYVINMLYMF